MSSTLERAGFGLVYFLTGLFITLKLIGHIDWSWWLVLSPALAPIAIAFGFAVAWVFIESVKDARKRSRQ